MPALGVAVGFGSQTLVKDVFSGVFYLLDDAFRVGEYITQRPTRNGGIVRVPVGEAAASPRAALHGAVRGARGGPEHEAATG